MTIEKIFVATKRGGPQMSVEAVRVVSGRGIEGDRNFGKAGRNITFVAAEEIERFALESELTLDFAATRRNVVTRGIELNRLVDEEFWIGAAHFRGIELCEPCRFLGARLQTATVSASRIVKLLAHRAGLRATVLSTATIRVGDAMRFS